jgi:putative ABC transport system permease protein
VISTFTAHKLWPKEDPIGRQFQIGDNAPFTTVVGVAGDVRDFGPTSDLKMMMYLPYRQQPTASATLEVKTTLDPMRMRPAVEGEIRKLDPDQPVYQVEPLDYLVAQMSSDQRLGMVLFGIFGGVALALASIGIYGVISFSVSQRTSEIGVRMALGARQNDVLRMMLAQGFRLVVFGVALGLAAAYALTRLLEDLLAGVSPSDPLSYAAASVILSGVALAATCIPAWRAASLDPMTALRYE